MIEGLKDLAEEMEGNCDACIYREDYSGPATTKVTQHQSGFISTLFLANDVDSTHDSHYSG